MDDRHHAERRRVSLQSRHGERTTLVEKRPRRAKRPPERGAGPRSDKLRLRRGWGNLGMTLVLPGSVQVRTGNKPVGRWAMRGWFAGWAMIISWLVVLLIDRGAALAIVAHPLVTALGTAWLLVGGVIWCLLMVDAWRLSGPPQLARDHRFGFAAVSGVLALGLLASLGASANAFHTQSTTLSTVFAGGGDKKVKEGRYNVLLLGGDAGDGREGLRPDSMTVASVDAQTGETVLFSLPRNLEDVQFPDDSPMKQVYPDGFDCPEHECMLNAVYTAATENADLYPGVANPGATATEEAISHTLGIEINTYVLIDLKGFEALVDSVGGITMDINKEVPVGGGSTEISRYLGPGEDIHLNGRDALWFARSREGSSDYERMERQKCVMNAMLKQLDPVTVATRFNDIARAGQQVVETDIPPGQIDTFLGLAQQAKDTEIRSVSFVPPLIQPGAPDHELIRTTVRDEIAASEAGASAAPEGSGEEAAPADGAEASAGGGGQLPMTGPMPGTDPTPGADPTPNPVTNDLASVCSAG